MKKLILAFLFYGLIINHTYSQEISQWRGSNRDGIYNEPNLLKEWPEGGPELLWKIEGLGIGYASAAVTSNYVLTAGTVDGTNYIFAFDINGKQQWKKEVGPGWMVNYPGVRSTPLIYGGLVYYLNSSGKLYCLHLENGQNKWSVNLFKDYDGKNNTWGITENLLIDNGILYCTPGGKDANVIALNSKTGELVWKSKGNGNISAYCSPRIIVTNQHKFLVTMTSESIISIDIENGKLAWKFPITNRGDGHANTAVFRNDSIFFIRGYQDDAIMLKIKDGGYKVEEVWRNPTLNMAMGDAILIENNIYTCASTSEGKLFAINWKNGREIYSKKLFPTGRLKGASIVSADGMLYCYGFSGKMYLAKPTPKGFEVVSNFQVGDRRNTHWAHPVIHNGKMYIRFDNTLFVYKIKA